MALIVEDGTGIIGAESYASVAEYQTYWGNRNATPTESTAEIESALRKATAYLDGKYRHRLKGCRTSILVQSLEFPRIGVQLGSATLPTLTGLISVSDLYLPSDVIPAEIIAATCEAAKRAISSPLAEDQSGNVKREKIDVIETEYFSASPQAPIYHDIDYLMNRFLKASNDVVRG